MRLTFFVLYLQNIFSLDVASGDTVDLYMENKNDFLFKSETFH